MGKSVGHRIRAVFFAVSCFLFYKCFSAFRPALLRWENVDSRVEHRKLGNTKLHLFKYTDCICHICSQVLFNWMQATVAKKMSNKANATAEVHLWQKCTCEKEVPILTHKTHLAALGAGRVGIAWVSEASRCPPLPARRRFGTAGDICKQLKIITPQ